MQVFQCAESLFLVHCTRWSGDAFAYHKFYVKLRDRIQLSLSGSGHATRRPMGSGSVIAGFKPAPQPSAASKDVDPAAARLSKQRKSRSMGQLPDVSDTLKMEALRVRSEKDAQGASPRKPDRS